MSSKVITTLSVFLIFGCGGETKQLVSHPGNEKGQEHCTEIQTDLEMVWRSGAVKSELEIVETKNQHHRHWSQCLKEFVSQDIQKTEDVGFYLKDYLLAIDVLLQGLSWVENKPESVAFNAWIGFHYWELERWEEARPYLDSAYSLREVFPDQFPAFRSDLQLGEIEDYLRCGTRPVRPRPQPIQDKCDRCGQAVRGKGAIVTEKRIGQYLAVVYIDTDRDAQLFEVEHNGTVVFSEPGNDQIFALGGCPQDPDDSGPGADYNCIKWLIPGTDITGDGHPNLVVWRFNGGNCDGCEYGEVYTLADTFQKVEVPDLSTSLERLVDLDCDGFPDLFSTDTAQSSKEPEK